MNTLGIGVDIVENSRIKKSLSNNKFIKRIFSEHEIISSKKVINKTAFFSKRFAAKEAFSKALGSGFRNGLNFKDISIINDKYGKPSIKVNSNVKKIIKRKFNRNKTNIHLSISDEKKHSIAFVVLEIK